MMGMCVFISPDSGKEEERYLDAAALNYLTKTRDLVKAAFVTFALAEFYISKRLFKDATMSLLRVANEVSSSMI